MNSKRVDTPRRPTSSSSSLALATYILLLLDCQNSNVRASATTIGVRDSRGAVALETSRKRLGDLHHPPPRSPWWPTSSSYSIAVSTDSSVQLPAISRRIMFACGFSNLGSSYFAFNDLAAGAVGCLIIISGNGNPLEIHSSDKGACYVLLHPHFQAAFP